MKRFRSTGERSGAFLERPWSVPESVLERPWERPWKRPGGSPGGSLGASLGVFFWMSLGGSKTWFSLEKVVDFRFPNR